MNKKVYKTPAMKIVMLRQQVTLLAGSEGVEADRKGYTKETDTWE